ncbi:hypothetical protein Vretimale_12780 [Volvox reticuliferus]|uniref:Uncharacterized protein n=1 Tax=Volvox reticuliferus TaxID=1737510 RepID=A0A8J4CE20_9CHLO|nr:hypothetical protein Vretifemale_10214 [Volvox reticuliferus]GIM08824.1 hypothetical protein Vretimale_12780 [Volvox reticuliferus]
MSRCVRLDEAEVKGCGAGEELADGHADTTNPPSGLVEDYPSRLQITTNGSSDPDRSLVCSMQHSNSQSSLTQNADSEGFGLPPVLLLLSPEIGRFEISVLDVAAWSSSPSWPRCRLPDSPGSAARNAASETADFESACSDGKAGDEASAVASPSLGVERTTNDEAVVPTTEADAEEAAMLAPVQPMTTACTGSPLRRITHPAPLARHAVRSVSVTRVTNQRGGHCVLDSPAGSTSTSTSGTFRSCLRPIRTWTTENTCLPSPGEARPTKTVRWLDHVAMQAVAEAQSAASYLHETSYTSLGGGPKVTDQNPDDTAATADESCTSLYDAAGLAVAQLSSLSSPGDLRQPVNPPEQTTEHSNGHEEVKTLEAILLEASPPPPSVPSQPEMQSNTYIENPSVTELLPPSPSLSKQQQQQQPQSQLHPHPQDLPEQQEQQQVLHRLLSPQMLRALERSQPISEVYTFTRSDSSDPSIVVVQPRYVAAAEAAGSDDNSGSCRVPLEWLNAGCFSDQHDDSGGNDDRSGVISVLDSFDTGWSGDPCEEFSGVGDDGWGQPQQANLHYLQQHMHHHHQQQDEEGEAVPRRILVSEAVRAKQGDSDVSRGVGGGGWGPGGDVERSSCGVPGSMSMLRTGSSTSASFGLGGVGLLSSDSGRASSSEDAGRHIVSAPKSCVRIDASPLGAAAVGDAEVMDNNGNRGVLMAASAGIAGSYNPALKQPNEVQEAPQAVPELHQHCGGAQITQQRLHMSLSGATQPLINRPDRAGEPKWDVLEQSAVRLPDMVAYSGVTGGGLDTTAGCSAAAPRAKHKQQGGPAASDKRCRVMPRQVGLMDSGRGAGIGLLRRLTAVMACWGRDMAPCMAATTE